jgi:hypothetical protein
MLVALWLKTDVLAPAHLLTIVCGFAVAMAVYLPLKEKWP